MIYYLPITILLLALSFVFQEFMPPIEWAYYARPLLIHATFFCLAVTVPYPAMLGLAFLGGYVYDARYHVAIQNTAGESTTELAFGLTILLFALMGSFIQGVRPLFRRGRWELPVLMVGICTMVTLTFEYSIISFRRGGLDLSPEIWFKMLMSSLFSMIGAPILLILLTTIAKATGYRIKLQGISRNYNYGNSL